MHYYNRYMPYDSVTKATDKASVSADGHTYTNPKYMVRSSSAATPRQQQIWPKLQSCDVTPANT